MRVKNGAHRACSSGVVLVHQSVVLYVDAQQRGLLPGKYQVVGFRRVGVVERSMGVLPTHGSFSRDDFSAIATGRIAEVKPRCR
jgi:hypothetical protein